MHVSAVAYRKIGVSGMEAGPVGRYFHLPTTSVRNSTMAAKSTSASSAKKSPAAPDAIALLMADHKLVKSLFKKFEGMDDGKEKAAIVNTICDELSVHAQLEEEIFYPAVREAIEDDDLMDEADIEHACAKDLIAQLRDLEPGDDHYDARVTVLGEQINHHVEEEEGNMFKQARKADLDLKALGAEMQARKAELAEPQGRLSRAA